MYTIFDIVYGAYIEANKVPDDLTEFDDPLWEQPYNGNGDGWAFVGIDISGFDEADVFAVDALRWEPTAEQKQTVDDYIAKLPEEVRALLSEVKVWLIPSTS